jgi:hypothetical protein
VREANEIERAIGAFARAPNTGLIVTSSAFTIAQRDLANGVGQGKCSTFG